MVDAIARLAASLSAFIPYVPGLWFLLDATVHTQLPLPIVRQHLHKATAKCFSTEALMLWKAFRSLTPYAQLHIVKQESYRHQYGNGNVDFEAAQQRTTNL